MVELKQTLGYWTILSLSIGSILGTTIYFGAAIGARYSGNLVLVAWVLMSLVAVYIAAIFGELTAMFPKAGGAYEFSKQAYGRFLSFIIGWTTWLVGNITVVLLTVGAVSAIMTPGSLDAIVVSVVIVLLLNVVAYIGLEAGAIVLVGFAVLMVSMIVAIIARGAFFIDTSHFTPLLTHPLSSIFVTMFFLAEAYFGWEAATFLAEETINPRKTIPKALIQGTVLIGVLGFLLFLVILGIFPWNELIVTSAPLSEISALLFSASGKNIIAFGIFITLIGSAAAGIITMPRLLLAMSRDRLFLGHFKDIHPRFKTPAKAVVFQTVVILLILFMSLGNYELLLSLLVPLALIMYIMLIITVPILRFKQPKTERRFKVLFGKTGPVLIALLFLASVLGWLFTVDTAANTFFLSISLIVIGLPLYLLVELYYDPKIITEVNDLLAYVTLIAEKISYPADIKRDILAFFGNLRGKTVLEFGSGVGTLTLPLLKEVGPRGTVIATHFSRNHLKITGKRIERAMWETEGRVYGKPRLVHDTEHMRRVHPEIQYADAMVSVGMLSYLQDLDRILKQLWQIIPEGGKICFVEYSDFFHVLPNVEWLSSNKKIEERFRAAGFSVQVVRRKGLLWNKVFIYGIKSKEDVPFV